MLYVLCNMFNFLLLSFVLIVIVNYFWCSVKILDAMCGSTLAVSLFQIKLQKVLYQPRQMFFTVNSVDLIVQTRKYHFFFHFETFCGVACISFFHMLLYFGPVTLSTFVDSIDVFLTLYYDLTFPFTVICSMCDLYDLFLSIMVSDFGQSGYCLL